MKMALNLCDPAHQNQQSQSNHEKNSSQNPIAGSSTIYLTSKPQNCQGHQIQGKSETLSLLKKYLTSKN